MRRNNNRWFPAPVLTGVLASLLLGVMVPASGAAEGVEVDRIGGVDRYETSALIAEAAIAEWCALSWEATRFSSQQECEAAGSPVQTYTLARGDSFADALSAASLARYILISRRDDVPDPVVELLRRYDGQAQTAFLVGDTEVLSHQVEEELREEGVAEGLERLAGPDRYATNVAVFRNQFMACTDGGASNLTKISVAVGSNWPDGLAAAFVRREGGETGYCEPTLLVRHDRLPAVVEEMLTSNDTPSRPVTAGTDVVVVGGPAAISDAVLERIRELTGAQPRRLAGSDRQGTALAVAKEFYELGCGSDYGSTERSRCGVMIGRPDHYADAISAPTLMSLRGSPILLAESFNELGERNEAFIRQWSHLIDVITILGSEEVVSERVAEQARAAAEG